jgi:hypothetical protein
MARLARSAEPMGVSSDAADGEIDWEDGETEDITGIVT